MIAVADRWLLAVMGVVALAYIAILPHALDRLQPLTGDEPFYVMTAISILRDGDLDEANNYANRDYDEFYPPDPLPEDWTGWPAFPRTLPPHPANTDLDGLHTKHGLGLSVLIAGPYEALERLGAVLVIVGCSVLVGANMYLLARDAHATSGWAAAIACMLALSLPIAPYALLIFPEIPAALLLVYAVRRLAARSNNLFRWLLVGTAIGFLPWLHQRFVPTVLVLAGVTVARVWKERSGSVALTALAPVAVGGFSLIVYNFWLYDSPIQDTADHAGFNSLSGTINATFGLLLDAQWGLLIAAPLYLLALVCIPAWARVSQAALLALIAVAPYILVVASYRVWWGEWGPPARYLVPIAPFAAGALAIWINRVNWPGRFAAVTLWAMGMVLMIIGAIDPQRLYHQPTGTNNLFTALDDAVGTDIATVLVAFQPLAMSPFHQRTAAAIALIAITLAIGIVVYILPRISQQSVSRVTQSEAGD